MGDSPSNSLRQSVTAPRWRGEPLRIRSIVLLAGAVSPGSLAARLGRSVLDFPVESSMSLLDVWRRRIDALVHDTLLDASAMEVRILADEANPLPHVASGGPLRMYAERDAGRYRGTAGVLRDLCARFRDDDHVVVGTASQCPDDGLLQQLVAESDPSDGVTLGSGRDGAPNGLLLVRCEALRQISPVGYVDLKEQALPRIAKTSRVRVVVNSAEGSTAIRDLGQYVDAVRSWHCFGSLRGVRSVQPFEERWRPVFSIVEKGAQVAPTARLHDSVVLAGGVVDAGCHLVRSVVGPEGVVRSGRRIIDQLVVGRSNRTASASIVRSVGL